MPPFHQLARRMVMPFVIPIWNQNHDAYRSGSSRKHFIPAHTYPALPSVFILAPCSRWLRHGSDAGKTNVSGHTLVVTDVAPQAGAKHKVSRPANKTQKNSESRRNGNIRCGRSSAESELTPYRFIPSNRLNHTGNELVEPGTAPQPGQVYESNSL